MSNENNLNDIIKSKFSSREHPFDEANWKAMRTMIDASRAKKKRTLWLAGAAALLLCAGGVAGIYELNNQGGKSNNGAGISSVNNISHSSVTNNTSVTNAASQAANSSAKNTSGNGSQASVNNTAVVVNQAPANGNNSVAAVTNSHSQPVVKNKKHKARSGNSGIAASNKEIADLNKTMADVEKNTTAGNVLSLKEASPNSSPTTPPLPVNSTPPITPKATPPPVTKTVAKAPDTANSLPQRFSDEPRVFNGKKQLISVEAGTFYSGGWSPGLNITQGSGWNYVVGVGYTHYLKKKIFLKTGIQFSDFGHMNSYSYNYQSSSPQNPNIVNDSVITTKRLYYLSVPVQFEFFFGQHKSSLGFGGAASYLLTSTASATTYQQLDNNPPENVQSYSQNIHLNGYNTWSASFYGLYRFTYNRHLSAYGMIYFMTPVENKAFFGEDLYLYNKGLKFLLSYTL